MRAFSATLLFRFKFCEFNEEGSTEPAGVEQSSPGGFTKGQPIKGKRRVIFFIIIKIEKLMDNYEF
ncbi:hypothetical protein BCD67_20785 [Oscillatoriales cyanobacterium USR001]|nr:hypothetical protein BCD67_20785 [Oscillatoriales cyanobacterium USR001]